ncbi:DNA-3-methyladenine glycosylase [Bacillaceae bacterium]
MSEQYGKIVDKSFFAQPTLTLAKRLLGMELVHEAPEGTAAGRIVEVEAYLGPEDKAAHSYGGRLTERTKVMYGPPGHAYLFHIYGMHICFNVVSGPVGKPEAILVRALEPTQGIPLMAARRRIAVLQEKDGRLKLRQRKLLTNGPGKLCQALGLTMEHYGCDLTVPPVYLRKTGEPLPDEAIASGPRINIDYAEEAREYPWRFWIKGNPFVSK